MNGLHKDNRNLNQPNTNRIQFFNASASSEEGRSSIYASCLKPLIIKNIVSQCRSFEKGKPKAAVSNILSHFYN